MDISQLETPCLLLDKPKVQKNIQRMEAKMRELGVNLRPHGKTAKSIDVLSLLTPENRQRVTVSTLKEAEYYYSHGVQDIVYAVGISPNKLARAANLIKQGAQLTLLLDSVEQVQQCVAAARSQSVCFRFLIEIDADDERGGISCNDDALLEIAQCAANSDGVELTGILTHAGGSYNARALEDIVSMAQREHDAAVHAATRLKEAGHLCSVVSVGSTPTAMFGSNLSGITEVRAGVFMFFDLVMHGLGVCDMGDIGVSVLTSVIGKNAQRNWILTDSGWMAMSRDRGTQHQKTDFGYGQVCDAGGEPISGMMLAKANQEHGIIELDDESPLALDEVALGSMLRVLPNHACATSAMYSSYCVTSDNKTVEARWDRINGW